MTCSKCGHVNAPTAVFCAQCGANITGPTPTQISQPVFPPLFFGAMIGFFITIGVWMLGAALVKIGSHPNVAFAGSQGSAWFYLISLVATIGALIGLFLPPTIRALDRNVRFVMLGAAFVILGGMSLCNLFTVSSLFEKG